MFVLEVHADNYWWQFKSYDDIFTANDGMLYVAQRYMMAEPCYDDIRIVYQASN